MALVYFFTLGLALAAPSGPEPVPLVTTGPDAIGAGTINAGGGAEKDEFREYVHDPSNYNIGADGHFFFLSSGQAISPCNMDPEDWTNVASLGLASYYADASTNYAFGQSPSSPWGTAGPVASNTNWPRFARCDYRDGQHATGAFDAPGVKCETSPSFASTKNANRYHCVMYYSVYMSQGDGAEMGQACIGRAVGNGNVGEIWVADDKPVTCSNLVMDANGMPTDAIFGTEMEWAAATKQALGIDPDVFQGFDGKYYLTWGSHMPGGAQVVLLDDDGFISPNTEGVTSVTNPSGEQAVAYKVIAQCHLNTSSTDPEEGRTGEAPAVLPHQCGGTNYYYLFWTWGRCCNGLLSTYETVMGRSSSPYGPYLDKDGRDMAIIDASSNNPGGSYFLRSGLPVSDTDASAIGTRYLGPGHVAFFEYASGVSTVMVVTFHFYDAERGGDAYMGARVVHFDDQCWPYVGQDTWLASEVLATTSSATTSSAMTSETESTTTSSAMTSETEETSKAAAAMVSSYAWRSSCLIVAFILFCC